MEQVKAKANILIDNNRVRVTEWRLVPGAETGHHRHETDYVVVPMMSGKLLLRAAGEEKQAELTKGAPYFREAGVEHNTVNGNNYEFVFMEIELK